MITQIDVREKLGQLGHGLDLVTRPTGRAVRSSIELELANLTGRTVVVLDFSSVRIIDCSCADEIVAKLVQASLAAQAPLDAFFLVRGLDDHQIDDVEEVLSAQRLAMVAEVGGRLMLVGAVADNARRAFGLLAERGRAAAEELADALSWPADFARAVLEELALRRLVLHDDAGHYQTPSAAA